MSETEKLTLRRADNQDRDALRRFAKEIWPGRREDVLERRWWWLTVPKQCLIAVSASGDIAAMAGDRQCRVAADGDVKRATDICDWYVSPRYAGQGLGRALVAELMEQYDLLFTISISDDAVAGFTRLGWSVPSSVSMSLSPVPALSRGIAAILARRTGDRFRLEEDDLSAPAIGTEFDDLWQRALPAGTLAMVRDSRELRWRLAVVPGRRYRSFRCYASGVLVGYMLARVIPRGTLPQLRGLPTGVIADFLVDGATRDAFVALLEPTLRWLVSQGAGVVVTMTTDPRFAHVLAQTGFLSPETLIVGRALRRLGTRSSTVFPGDRVRAARWYLTLADSDLDFTLGADAD